MLRTYVSKMLYLLTYAGLAVMGCIVTIWNFTGLYTMVPVSILTVTVGAVIGSVAATIVFALKKWSWLGRILILLSAALFIRYNLYSVVGGISYIVNFLIENINNYYSSQLYYVFFTDKMLEHGDQSLAVMLLCVLAGYGYMSVFLRGKGGTLAAVGAVLCYLLPVTMDNELPSYELVGTIVFVICCVAAGTNKNPGVLARKSTLQTMAWLGTASAVIILALMLIVPREGYVPSESFEAVRGKYVFSIEDFREYTEKIKDVDIDLGRGDGISAGSIGNIGSIKYKDEPMFLVRAPKDGGTIYLKAFQAAVYTRTRWYALDGSIYEEYSDMFENSRQAGFDPYLQVNSTLDSLADRGTVGIAANCYDVEVIQYYGDNYSYVPMDTTSIDGKKVSEYTSQDREIHLPTDASGKSDIHHLYTITQWQDDTDLTAFIVSGALAEGKNQKQYSDFVYKNYMDVNTSCGDRIVEELIPQIISRDYDLHTPEGKLTFIKDTVNFFKKEYSYTLRPGTTPSDRDFVENFLFVTKKGFCTYFASASVMIFRAAGIPARYVEGYVVPNGLFKGSSVGTRSVTVRNDEKSRQELWDYYEAVVTDRYAHAWVEVYMDGVGWIIVDPTPGYSRYPGENGEDESLQDEENDVQQDNNETDSEATDKEENESVNETSNENQGENQGMNQGKDPEADNDSNEQSLDSDKNIAGEGEGKPSDSGIIADNEESEKGMAFKEVIRVIADMAARAGRVFLFVIKIVAVPAVVILFFIFRQKYMEEKRVKIYNGDCGLDRRERVRKVMAYYENILKFLHRYPRANDSYAEIFTNQKLSGNDSYVISKLVEKALYSEAVLDDDEVMQVMAYVYAFRQQTYGSLSRIKRIIFKYILAY